MRQKNGEFLLSTFLINRYENDDNNAPVEHILFQPELTITGLDDEYVFVRRDISQDNLIDDEDLDRSKLLYRNNPDFAIGHGCSVQWYDFTNEIAKTVKNYIYT
ncbi:hypothetical protein NBRC111894_4240 [Sporolactobacillus inulinus]|uniref:Uncharacterized protein n=1 Tax=Sporolactobacillus inulinus TaxID=2078 RepID=A0A4Y1ZHJ5_9BACL|nr:hypothetical protein [Sporolactobacillus inulinus]GAY78686.1 hypothetical protein NBRC111894_4240 [Sporolactobacillus inulinus]